MDKYGKANVGIIAIFHCRRAQMNKYYFYLHYFLHLPYHFTLREMNPQYPLYRRLGGPQIQSVHYGKEKSFLPLPGIESQLLSNPVCSLVVPTELARLQS
jgi:hypothetical protein